MPIKIKSKNIIMNSSLPPDAVPIATTLSGGSIMVRSSAWQSVDLDLTSLLNHNTNFTKRRAQLHYLTISTNE